MTWITTAEAADRLGNSPDAVRKLRLKGRLTRYHVEQDGGMKRAYFDADEVDALRREWGREATTDTAAPIELPPVSIYALIALWSCGGVIASERGRTTSVLHKLVGEHRYSSASVSMGVGKLDRSGLVEREMNGKRTFRIALTQAGRDWLAENRDLVSSYALTSTEPEPEPEPEPERVSEALALVEPEPEMTPPSSPPPVPTLRLNDNGHAAMTVDVEPSAIAGALLRQVVRTLNDSETATLMAERDALRAHNDVLGRRVADLTAQAERVDAENRELRGVLHGIEMQLSPMLGGNDHRFDWLDATTRTDLLRLLNDAARWATTSQGDES